LISHDVTVAAVVDGLHTVAHPFSHLRWLRMHDIGHDAAVESRSDAADIL